MDGEQGIVAFGVKEEGKEYKDRPAVYAVIMNERHEVAVVRSRGRLLLPGGGMEDEESREECLRRECAEELGYDIGIGAYIGSAIQYMPTFMTWEPLQVTGYFYQAILLGPNGNQSEPDHTLEWLPAEEAVYNMYTAFSRWAIRLCYDKAIVY